jgi:hypothetical protein
MLNTTSGLNNYRRQFHVKAMHLNLLELDDQLYLVDHYITYCQTAMRHDKKKTQVPLTKAKSLRSRMRRNGACPVLKTSMRGDSLA